MAKILNMNSMNNKQEEDRKELVRDLREIQRYRNQKNNDEQYKPTVVIEFSWKLVALIALGVLAVFLGKQLITVCIFLFGSFVFMSAAKPIVAFFMSKNISKGFSVFLTYFLGVVLLSALISTVIIPFADQIGGLISAIPDWIKNFTSSLNDISILGLTLSSSFINSIVTDILGRFTMLENFQNIAGTVSSLFSSTALLVACLVSSIYLVIDHDNILELGLTHIVSDVRRERVEKLILDMESKIGKWLLGQATVSTIAGTVTGLALTILGIPFSLPMGVFVALMSAIPTLGATIGAIPPVFVALVVYGPVKALIVIAVFVIYQQIENNLIIPKIMGNVMGVRPIFVMFAAVTFFVLFGVWGAVLAVPIIVISRICYEFYIDLQKLQAKGSI